MPFLRNRINRPAIRRGGIPVEEKGKASVAVASLALLKSFSENFSSIIFSGLKHRSKALELKKENMGSGDEKIGISTAEELPIIPITKTKSVCDHDWCPNQLPLELFEPLQPLRASI